MPEDEIVARVGLISDTHFQDRLFDLPEQLARVWGPVDLILHAGDVGDLSVLDQLGRLAPVVAVHGNDEPEQSQRDLPEQQLLVLGGVRLLLWHSHYPDRVVERASRGGVWGPKLERLAARTLETGAQALIYGHSHVPALNRQGGVILFNPGALAAGSYFTRQAPQTVGRLRVLAGGQWEWEHLDLASGEVLDLPAPSPAEDFSVLGGRYQLSIAEPDLALRVPRIYKIQYEDLPAVVQALKPVYRRSLARGLVLRQEMLDALRDSSDVTEHDRQCWIAALSEP